MMSSAADLYTSLEDMSVKGGSEIGVVAAAALQAFALENDQKDSLYLDRITQYGQRLKNLKPTMASVHNIVDQMIHLISQIDLGTPEGQETLARLVAAYRSNTEKALQEVARLFSNLVVDGDVIFTHSFTKSAVYALTKAAESGKRFSMICNESRPLREGILLATQMAACGIPVRVITDAAMAHYLPECTKVVVGADALYTDGTIVNKMGTLAVAMLAKAFQKPVYVLTITSKLYMPSLQGLRLELERRPGTEVMDPVLDEQAKANLSVENTFFEEVPGEYTTYLVTEKGVLKPGQLLGVAQNQNALEE